VADLTESQLQTLCAALGWQGGTYWQVVDEIRRLKATDHWQPIETAPMDGGDVLLYYRDWLDRNVMEVRPYCLHGGGGARSMHAYATHWQLLPPPPGARGEESP
jgi:hypothetical protein